MKLRAVPLLLTTLLALAGCRTPETLPGPEAERVLAIAEAAVDSRDFDAVETALEPLAGEACPKRLRDRRDFALARVHFERGELWDAFEVLEPFPDNHPHSELRAQVSDMLWEIGNTLAASDGGFLFFWSDRRAGRTVLEHLQSRYPDSPRNADALRILGDMAFESEDYLLAEERFRDLMLNHPDGEWFVYAQYRFAMSIVGSVLGPDYDLARMDHAVRELRDFLAVKPENPAVVADAEMALARLNEWRADRHLRIARFYERVGNRVGYRHHLGIAATDEFAATPYGIEARALVAEFDAAERAGVQQP